MEAKYPTALPDLPAWAHQHRLTPADAEARFIAYAAIDSIAHDPFLSSRFALRGSAVLRLFHGLPRPTHDMDFIDTQMPQDVTVAQRQTVITAVNNSLAAGLRRHFPDYDHWRDQLHRCVKVQISPKDDPSFDFQIVPLVPGGPTIGVASAEFVLAEKFAALLSQPLRKISRPQDAADIAWMSLHSRTILDSSKIAAALATEKQVLAGHFKLRFDEPVRAHTAIGFDKLTWDQALPMTFDQAWAAVLELARFVLRPADLSGQRQH